MNLDVSAWKEFVFTDIFKLRGGFYNKKPEHSIEGNIPFLASTEANNGVTEYYSIEDIEQWDKVGNEDYSLDKKMFDGNCIAVTVNGSVCNAFYQPERFTCSHDITVLYLKKHTLNPYIGLFLSTMIMRDKYRWSYGRKPHNVKKFGKSIIKLPVDSKGNPDWQFMEDYIKSLHHKPFTTKNKVGQAPELKVTEWKEFRFGDLITAIYKSKAINKDDLSVANTKKDSIRYITRTAENNGCELLAVRSELPLNIIEDGNAISIGDTTATCFYQDEDFITGDHMVVVRADLWLNQYTGLFIAAMLQGEQYKYSYGRAFLMERIRDTIIKLPVDTDGNPNWQFMENYIKSLPYGDRLEG